MAQNTSPIFIREANIKGATWVGADAVTKKDVFVAGSWGSLLRALSIVSGNNATTNVDLTVSDGTNEFPIGTIPVATGSGVTAATNAINGLDTTKIKVLIAPDGSLFLPVGWRVRAGPQASLAAGTLTIVGAGGNY